MTHELATIGDVNELMVLGKAMSASGGAFSSMANIHIIKGKPVIGANLMAAAVKAHPKYDYRVTTNTNELVEIVFYQDGKQLAVSNFSMQDAKAAGLAERDNWLKFPRNMLFARAISNGVRWYCPDVFSGNAVYTPGELGDDVEAVAVDLEVKDTQTPNDIDFNSVPPIDPKPHWIEDTPTRKRFWMWTSDQGLTDDQVHEALGVEHVKDFDGDKAAALAKVNDWIDAQIASTD